MRGEEKLCQEWFVVIICAKCDIDTCGTHTLPYLGPLMEHSRSMVARQLEHSYSEFHSRCLEANHEIASGCNITCERACTPETICFTHAGMWAHLAAMIPSRSTPAKLSTSSMLTAISAIGGPEPSGGFWTVGAEYIETMRPSPHNTFPSLSHTNNSSQSAPPTNSLASLCN